MRPKIQLFENFEQRDANIFLADIKKDKISFSLYQEPGSLKHSFVYKGEIQWQLSVFFKSWGIEIDETAIIKSMNFTVELEDENGDYYEKEIEVPEGILKPEQFKTTFMNFDNRQISLLTVDITMRHSEDPEDWEIELGVGNTIDY